MVCWQHWTAPVEHESRASRGAGVATARKAKARGAKMESFKNMLRDMVVVVQELLEDL